MNPTDVYLTPLADDALRQFDCVCVIIGLPAAIADELLTARFIERRQTDEAVGPAYSLTYDGALYLGVFLSDLPLGRAALTATGGGEPR